MKEETALETYKLIKILPGPIYDVTLKILLYSYLQMMEKNN